MLNQIKTTEMLRRASPEGKIPSDQNFFPISSSSMKSMDYCIKERSLISHLAISKTKPTAQEKKFLLVLMLQMQPPKYRCVIKEYLQRQLTRLIVRGGSGQITCNYHTIIPDTVACTILICFLWLSEVDSLGCARPVHFSLLFFSLPLSLSLSLSPPLPLTLSRSVTHTYFFFLLRAWIRSRRLDDEFTADSISIYIYFPFSLFLKNSLRRTHAPSRSALCHFLFFPVVVHLQDSHYIPYRSVNSTQNFGTPYTSLKKQRETEAKKWDAQSDATGNPCALLTTHIIQTFKKCIWKTF